MQLTYVIRRATPDDQRLYPAATHWVTPVFCDPLEPPHYTAPWHEQRRYAERMARLFGAR